MTWPRRLGIKLYFYPHFPRKNLNTVSHCDLCSSSVPAFMILSTLSSIQHGRNREILQVEGLLESRTRGAASDHRFKLDSGMRAARACISSVAADPRWILVLPSGSPETEISAEHHGVARTM